MMRLLFALQGGPLPNPEIPSPPVIETGLSGWLIFTLIVAGILATVLVGLLIFKPKALSIMTAERPLRKALKTLNSLRNRAEGLPVSHIAAEVSGTLRGYYMGRYEIPAPYRTTEELFPMGVEEHGMKRRQWRARFDGLAEIYDRLEFSNRDVTHTEALALLDSAINKLEDERLNYDDGD
jgi:hypothetical protein